MEKSIYKQSLFTLALAAALGTVGSITPTFAAGGKAAGGSTAGVSHGSTDQLSSFGVIYNGAVPKGQVGLVSAADGTPLSMTFKLNSLNVPDGTVLPIRVIMGKKTIIFGSYYSTYGVAYTETDGTVVVSHKSVAMTLDAAVGDPLPDFPDTSVGTTDIRILSSDGSVELLSGITGHFSP